ncbi:MAG: glycine--tRNA ligase [Candidatus Micrarchaeota archaeon]
MTKPDSKNAFADELTTFLADKDFVYGPEPEIYGGAAGFYTYGPLGKRLKNNVENAIRRVFNQNGFYEIEYPIVSPEIVWKASGHADSFNDPVIVCSKCANSFRADKLLEENGVENAGHFTDDQMIDEIENKKIVCPHCKGRLVLEINRHSLMMKTMIGRDQLAYNRPETATTTYLPFKRYLNFFRQKTPFGVFQIGKAFRNEISPRQHVLRSREFTQAESQLFLHPDKKNQWDKWDKIKTAKLPFWPEDHQKKEKKVEHATLEEALSKKWIQNQAFGWSLWLAFELFIQMGIPHHKIRLRQHFSDERAFYASDAWDLEIELQSYGWTECCGIHDRGDYDLNRHAKFSKQKLVAKTEDSKEFVPHVIEIAFGIDRPFFALCDLYYDKRETDEKRTIFSFPPQIAPIQVAVFPLVNKDGLNEFAEKIYQDLQTQFLVVFDDTGSIGRRYARMDSVGTPYCLTIDYDSLKNNDVTIRERDSMKQIRVKIPELPQKLNEYLQHGFNGEKK